ncbi:MAG: YeiH family protein [Verrucomicrobiota bacterium JB022]|nr:YeiH family protein [Verrucomicrobiota bacterium JB022]
MNPAHPQTAPHAHLLPGLLLTGAVAAVGFALAQLPSLQALHLSPLVLAIVVGLLVGNLSGRFYPAAAHPGVGFCQKRILRLAIVLFGFRVTFQQIAGVGLAGLAADVVMLCSTLVLGLWLGRRVFGLDRDTAILCAAGSSICGAAAILATEPVLKPAPHKVTVAVGTVVLFGSLAMFAYPALYHWAGMDAHQFGIYTGSTVHEVAQVVAVGGAVGGGTAETAVIVKLARVMLLAPFLLVLSCCLSREGGEARRAITIPWFAVLFVVVAGINSLNLLPSALVQGIVWLDTVLLTLSMAALGLDSRFSRFRGVGAGPIYCGLAMFAWLIAGGWAVNTLLCRWWG